MRTHARMRVAAGALLLALGAAACGGGDEDPPAGAEESSESADGGGEETSTTSTAPESTTTTLSPEDAVWQSVSEGAQALAALEAPDPNAPALVQYFTGDSLALLQQAMTDDLAGNTTRQSTIELHRYSVTVSGDTADVDYCFIDTTQLLAGGQPTGPVDVAAMRANAHVQRIDGQWKVASETREEEQCPAG